MTMTNDFTQGRDHLVICITEPQSWEKRVLIVTDRGVNLSVSHRVCVTSVYHRTLKI